MMRASGGAEIGEDLAFQRREWKAEHIGRMGMLLIALAALAGVLGPGTLSRTSSGDEGSPLRAEYNRFERYQSPMALEVYIRPEGQPAAFGLSQGYLRRFEVEGLEPSPVNVRTGQEDVTYLFDTDPGLSMLHVTVRLKPTEPGIARGKVQAPGGLSVPLTQLIYP